MSKIGATWWKKQIQLKFVLLSVNYILLFWYSTNINTTSAEF